MNIHFRRKGRTAVFPAALLLLFFVFLPGVSAQTQTEEEIETGRFGAEEPEEPETAAGGTNHTNKWLYLGVRAGPSLRFYTPSGDTPFTGGDSQAAAMDAAFQARFQAFSFLSIQGELVFTWDNASVWNYRRQGGTIDRYTRDYAGFSLQFPLTVRLNWYPGKFRVSPFFGASYLLPLGKITETNSLDDDTQSWLWRVSPPFGVLGGLSGALKLGPGMIVADLRYAVDLGEPEPRDGGIPAYRRRTVSLTVGYELGFFTKNGGTNHE
jgi:hypothetical protein